MLSSNFYSATAQTRITYNHRIILISIALGVLSLVLLGLFYNRSERYFLKVEGAVKTMDIALYKWFRNNSSKVVTIGKSIDCSLQLSWDMYSTIAPVQAQIILAKNKPYLVALEEGGIYRGKPLTTNKKVHLVHGASFTIGKTTFTYLEKDR